MKRIRLGTFLALLALTAGCAGNADTEGASDSATTSPDDPIYERARVEGSVVLYSSIAAEQMQKWIDGFSEAYPGVEVEFVRANGAETLERVRAEAAAGRTMADVVSLDLLAGLELEKSGALGQIPQESIPEGYPEEHLSPWSITWYASPAVIAWNTAAVMDPPASLDDLLEPAHRGCVISTNYQAFLASLIADRGEPAAAAWLEAFLANGGVIGDNQSAVVADLASGALRCAANPALQLVGELIAEGAPVDWVAPPSTGGSPTGLFVTTQPPHPSAAALLIRWLLGEQAASIGLNGGRVPVMPGVASPAADPLLGRGVLDRLRVLTPKQLTELRPTVETFMQKYIVPNQVAKN